MSIDVKEAIVKAKAYAEDLFDVGTSGRVTLEEVWFDDSSNEWSVTVGIRHRKAERLLNPLVSLSSLEGDCSVPEYKIVRLTQDTGDFIAIRNYDRVVAE